MNQILVIDDEKSILNIVKQVLSKYGYKVDAVQDLSSKPSKAIAHP